MDFGVGNIVSLVIAALVTALVVVFFVRKKSPALIAIYGAAMLIFIGIHILAWFHDGMTLATSTVDVIVVIMGVVGVVVYQNDFKQMFVSLSKIAKKQHAVSYTDEDIQKAIDEIVKACQTMSKARTGALILIVPTKLEEQIKNSGVEIGGKLSASLLVSIFNTKAPMHDGAVIVEGNKVVAAGCFLPLSQTQSISKDIGTRHRAAIGITEESDNVSIVVSEENGIISVAKKGILRRYITPERLSDILYETYGMTGRMKN